MKLTILTIILIVSTIDAAPNWVPSKHVKAFDKLEATGRRMAMILRTESKIDCQAIEGSAVFTILKHDLKITLVTDISVKACSFSEGKLKLEFNKKEKSCGWLVAGAGAGGFILGLGACALIRN